MLPIPNPQVTNAIVSVAIPNKQMVFGAIPGALITVFESNKSFNDIHAAIAVVPDVHFILSELGETGVCTLFPPQFTQMTGRGSRQSNEDRLAQLQRKLNKAIEDQNFELATIIRDQIKALK